ncbi:MAG TPA: valine--tRNA ligase, partial [Thermoflexia bacterium]|nr:valine--tRNA ligase [Thermoflexia bacterium]
SQEHASHLWYIRYPLANEDWDGPQHEWGSGRWAEGATEFIEMATTRPETIVGDTGVAVNPSDERWSKLIGRQAILPVNGRALPIVGDEAVEVEFGTGAVKVTPAHDPTDYEIGARHGLDALNVLTETAQMNAEAGPYVGLGCDECRQAIVADFEREGLLVKIEGHQHAVGHCERCDTIIEPRISTQWFVRTKPLAEKSLDTVRSGEMRIIPARFEKIFFHWMENIRDWCISRQLWWGHRIPVWYCAECGQEWSAVEDPTTCPQCGSARIEQDPDVLDTWFSSGLWPFSTLGWPDLESPDLQRFFPTNLRETGYDILFFWVARETMLSLELMGQAPFSTVYLHGLIRDEHGQKISKSMPDAWKYDPLYIIDEYGTDALRYTLATSSSPGNDMSLDLRRIAGARNFANKLWQATRFILLNLAEGERVTPLAELAAEQLLLEDRWILSRLYRVTESVTELMEAYQYGEAGRQLRDFIWDEFCDWYIEAAKVRLYAEDEVAKVAAKTVLLTVLEQALRLLHPFMPYVTEVIWQALPPEIKAGEALMIAAWPQPDAARLDVAAEERLSLLMELVRGIRNVRAEYHVPPGKRIAALLAAGEFQPLFAARRELLSSLARLDAEQLEIVAVATPPAQAAPVVAGELVIYLPLAGLVDLEAERRRLRKSLRALEGRITGSQRKLAGPFAERAPAHIVERERALLVELQGAATQTRAQLARLE